MRKVSAWVTSDGEVWLLKEEAVRHAEERYGKMLLEMSKAGVSIEKYTSMINWVEDNLKHFAELNALRDDREVKEEGDGNDD